jgi:aminoglycoside phosphotransferase (APT) family kinase protein
MATPRTPLRIRAPFPRTGDDLAGEWLPSALGLDPGTAHAVSVQRIGEHRGHMGQAYRLSFTCRHGEHPAESVVVKVAAPEGEALETAERGGLYLREFRFFTEIAPRSPARVPVCFAAGYADGDGFALVLEDLGNARVIDQVDGIGVEDARSVLSQLAAFHASWWESPALDGLTWATRHTDEARIDNLTRLLRAGWPRLCEAVGEALPSTALSTGLAMADHLEASFTLLGQSAQTLLHGDVRLDNLMFEGSGPSGVAALLDWQSLSRGPAAIDVSYFLAQNLSPDTLRCHGDHLLAHYREELAVAGVKYSTEHLQRALALATPLTFAVASSLFVLADPAQDRTWDLAVAMASRAIAFTERYGSASAAPLSR